MTVRPQTATALALSVFLWFSAVSAQQSVWRKLLRVLGISATAAGQRAPDFNGNIVFATIEGNKVSTVFLSKDGNYSSPIIINERHDIVALQRHELVRLDKSGSVQGTLLNLPGIQKLVSVYPDDPDKLIVLRKDANGVTRVDLVSLAEPKSVQAVAGDGSELDPEVIGGLASWNRQYPNVELTVRKELRLGNHMNVYIKGASGDRVNISNCSNADCGQPSLFSDFKSVVYIKSR